MSMSFFEKAWKELEKLFVNDLETFRKQSDDYRIAYILRSIDKLVKESRAMKEILEHSPDTQLKNAVLQLQKALRKIDILRREYIQEQLRNSPMSMNDLKGLNALLEQQNKELLEENKRLRLKLKY